MVQPGLGWRLMTAADRGAIIAATTDAATYRNPDERDQWYRDPLAWPLVLQWRNRILEFEVLHFPHHNDPIIVTGGFIHHLTGDRPHWFWRECERPIWKQLLAMGCERLIGHVRSDRLDWVDRLKSLYGGREAGVAANGAWVKIEYETTRAMAACTGWPVRRSAVIPGIRELTLDEATTLIAEAWGDRPRKAEAFRIADEWWSLDSATILEIGGHLRILRERFPDEARLAVLTPLDAPMPEVRAKVQAWARAVGYKRITGMVPAAQERATGIVSRGLPGARMVRSIPHPAGDLIEVTDDL